MSNDPTVATKSFVKTLPGAKFSLVFKDYEDAAGYELKFSSRAAAVDAMRDVARDTMAKLMEEGREVSFSPFMSGALDLDYSVFNCCTIIDEHDDPVVEVFVRIRYELTAEQTAQYLQRVRAAFDELLAARTKSSVPSSDILHDEWFTKSPYWPIFISNVVANSLLVTEADSLDTIFPINAKQVNYWFGIGVDVVERRFRDCVGKKPKKAKFKIAQADVQRVKMLLEQNFISYTIKEQHV